VGWRIGAVSLLPRRFAPKTSSFCVCDHTQPVSRFILPTAQDILLKSLSIIMATRILPLELIDKAIGSQIWILMRGKTEVVGILRGFDDYVSKVRLAWF
jgi:LSM domain